MPFCPSCHYDRGDNDQADTGAWHIQLEIEDPSHFNRYPDRLEEYKAAASNTAMVEPVDTTGAAAASSVDEEIQEALLRKQATGPW